MKSAVDLPRHRRRSWWPTLRTCPDPSRSRRPRRRRTAAAVRQSRPSSSGRPTTAPSCRPDLRSNLTLGMRQSGPNEDSNRLQALPNQRN